MKTIELNKEELEHLAGYLVTRGVILTQYIATFRTSDKTLFDKYVSEKRLSDSLLTKILKTGSSPQNA